MKTSSIKPKERWLELKYTEMRLIKKAVRFLVSVVKISYGLTLISFGLLVFGLTGWKQVIILTVLTLLFTVLWAYLNENVISVDNYWREQAKRRNNENT